MPETLLTLRVEQIHTYYGESYVLQGVSLVVPAGKVVALLGRNGMGKTTLIRSVTGLTPPRRGRVWYRSHEITRLLPYQIARLGIALVPQGRRIFGSLTVKENLDLPAWATSGGQEPSTADGWRLGDILDQFPNLKACLHRRASSLSGGEQQMLAIGRALRANPQLLLMDEPSEGLAPLLVETVKEILLDLKRRGQSILLVEQNFDLAMAVADMIYVMANGLIVYEGASEKRAERERIRALHLGLQDARAGAVSSAAAGEVPSRG